MFAPETGRPAFHAPKSAAAARLRPEGLIWMIAAVLLVIGFGGSSLVDTMQNDDLMRLVEVRDLVDGASWFDLTQKRLDPPEGTPMHWSRLADLPVAVPLFLLQPFVGRASAETLALTIAPLALLLLAVIAVAAIAGRLSESAWARPVAAVAMLSATPVLTRFMPGRIDHHGLQIALALAMLALVVAAIARRAAAGAGMPAAGAGMLGGLSLAVGLESLPYLLAGAASLGLAWVVLGRRLREALLAFGAALAATPAILFLATTPPAAYLAPACDALSIVYVGAALAGGAGLAVLALATPLLATSLLATPTRRLGAALAVAALAGAVPMLAYPQCLDGPYGAVDPILARVWLDNIREVRSIPAVWAEAPDTVAAILVFPLMGLIASVAAFAAHGGERRRGWGAVAVFLLTALAVTWWQIRGASFANAFAAPGVAWALVQGARRASALGSRPLRIVLLIGLPVVGNGLFPPTLGARLLAAPGARAAALATVAEEAACRSPATLAPLARRAAGVALGPIDLGPALLARTPHAVLAAPYHRNTRGNRDAVRAWMGDDATARAIARRREVDYFVLCPALPEPRVYLENAPDGLMARLLAGRTPDWLSPVALPPGNPLRLYRVNPARADN